MKNSLYFCALLTLLLFNSCASKEQIADLDIDYGDPDPDSMVVIEFVNPDYSKYVLCKGWTGVNRLCVVGYNDMERWKSIGSNVPYMELNDGLVFLGRGCSSEAFLYLVDCEWKDLDSHEYEGNAEGFDEHNMKYLFGLSEILIENPEAKRYHIPEMYVLNWGSFDASICQENIDRLNQMILDGSIEQYRTVDRR